MAFLHSFEINNLCIYNFKIVLILVLTLLVPTFTTLN